MLKTKTKSLRDRTADAIVATLTAHRKTGQYVVNPVITDGVACFYDGVSGFLLVVPLDEAEAKLRT